MTELCAGIHFPWICSVVGVGLAIIGAPIVVMLLAAGLVALVRYLRRPGPDL